MVDEIVSTKICIRCNLVKPKTDFHKNPNHGDGFYSMCKQCKRKYRISPEYKKRESELEKTNRYKSRTVVMGHRDRSSLPRCCHTLTYIEWESILETQQYRCAICGCSDKKLEHDCIIPISKGGALTFENTQALCNVCNSKKGSKLLSATTPN